MPMNEVILKKRKELGFTQEQIAEYLGVTAPAVNKWEKGVTCPDISLLPALARLLRVDLNTLFCFHQDMTQQEMIYYQKELSSLIEQNGIQAGFDRVLELRREYPNCEEFLYYNTLLLQGALMMSELTPDEKNEWEEKLLPLYEQCRRSENTDVKNGAVFMLAGKYLRQENCEKAQEMIDLLPERSEINKKMLQAEIYVMQHRTKEAAELAERMVLQSVNELQGALLKLTDMELAAGEEETAAKIAEIFSEFARVFGLWEYNHSVAAMEVAIARKDVKDSIRLFRKLLEAVRKPWDMSQSPLFYRIFSEPSVNTETSRKLFTPLISDLETNPRYEFLRQNGELQNLINEYREMK